MTIDKVGVKLFFSMVFSCAGLLASGGTVTWNPEGSGGWSSSITREPDNRNDSLNLYVYMGEGAKAPVSYSGGKSTKEYDIKAVLDYGVKENDGISNLTVTGMNYDSVDKVVYATGISTRKPVSTKQATPMARKYRGRSPKEKRRQGMR